MRRQEPHEANEIEEYVFNSDSLPKYIVRGDALRLDINHELVQYDHKYNHIVRFFLKLFIN